MLRYLSLRLFAFIFTAVLLASGAHASSSLLILGEDFQFTGSWTRERRSDNLGTTSLRSGGAAGNAVTAIDLAVGGRYTVWARAADYPENHPGTRRFGVAIDGKLLPREAGQSGADGWGWDELGTVQLSPGVVVLEIVDTARHFGRCDAVFLSRDTKPDALERAALLAKKVQPKKLDAQPVSAEARGPVTTHRPVASSEARPLATLESEVAKIAFFAARGPGGERLVRRETAVRRGAGAPWTVVPAEQGAETVLLFRSDTSQIETTRLLPRWRNPANLRKVEVAGRTYPVGYTDDENPWRASTHTVLAARSARMLGSDRVELSLASDDGKTTATLTWAVGAGGADFVVTSQLRAPSDGFYSVAFAPFSARDDKDVAAHQLPPLYQFKRAPDYARLVPSGVAPHPLVFIETQAAADGAPGFTLGVTGSPKDQTFEWHNAGNSRYGFSLQSDDGRIQPAAFRPVLGLADSQWRAGETRTLHWHVIARSGSWTDALAYATERIFGVTDYRHPVGESLTGSVRNMIDLMMHEAGGWDEHLKGFWNIEGTSLVTQAAPLAILSASVLTDDETLYVERALPSLEYLLTRPIGHFALKVPTTYPAYVNAEQIVITSPNHYYRGSTWQGFDALTGGANPWLAPLTESASRGRIVQGWLPRFAELLALYRQNPSPKLLEEVLTEARGWVDRALYAPKRGDIGFTPFYNHTFAPVWWDLLALHDLTGDARWLEAAELGGMLTVAGQRSQPAPASLTAPELIHKGDHFAGNQTIWWRGPERYRLGFPRTPGDVKERSVPAWVVSSVGLGLEQPSTFFASSRAETEGFQNITMSSWAPGLLRLHAKTGKTVYRDFARSSVIGRFGNYPGYYIRGFTDLPLTKRYPYDGPDVTSIYYHHIPPHLAFTLDWLFAEAELRSRDAIRFPWAQQAGYVWFNNRVYGQPGGEIFGHKNARPVLPKEISVRDEGLNWIAARTPNRLWVVLMNDAPEARPARVELDTAALGIDRAQPVLVHLPGDKADSAPRTFDASLTVPPRGLVALSYASKDTPRPTLPPVAAEPVSVELEGKWGTLHAWRIRSPFGKDSLFVCLSGRPGDGAKVELLADQGLPANAVTDRFPYEFSVYPLPHDTDIAFRLRLTTADGAETISPRITLRGAR